MGLLFRNDMHDEFATLPLGLFAGLRPIQLAILAGPQILSLVLTYLALRRTWRRLD